MRQGYLASLVDAPRGSVNGFFAALGRDVRYSGLSIVRGRHLVHHERKRSMGHQDYELRRAEVRAVVGDVIRPNAERVDRDGLFPRDSLSTLGCAGWNGVLAPRELGGLGLDHVAFAIAAEEIGRACASTGLAYVMHVGAAQTIALYGNEDQKKRWLVPARDGVLGTYSTSEKASGGHWWF